MAEWSKNKVEPSAINGGKEFVEGDNLAVNELNAIVNNSFFASEKAESAEQKVNSFVEEKGKTAVTIEGEVQSKWSADFIEKEKSKSLNLWTHGDIQGANEKTTIILDNPLPAEMYYIKYYYEHDSTHMYATIGMYLYDEDGVRLQSLQEMYGSSGYFDVGPVLFVRPIKKIEFGVTSPNNSDIVYEGNYKFSDIMISPEPLKVYEKPRGAITHNNDAPVVFAESERQKSKNLWAYGDVSGTKGKDIILKQPLPIGTYTISYVAESTDTDSSKSLIEFYDENGKWVAGDNVERNKRASITKTFTVPVGRISFYASTSFAGGTNDTFTFSNIQIEEGKVATDYQPYNGATVREKQFKEAVEKRELLFNREEAVDIEDSELDTLKEYFDLFQTNQNVTYFCNIGALVSTNFKSIVGTPSGFGNYAHCYIKKIANGYVGSGGFYAYELIVFDDFSSKVAKGYIYKNANDSVVFSGWMVIGG